MINKGCTLVEFKKAASEFTMAEERKGTDELAPEIDNEFFSTIGLQGWSSIHAACT